jgi:hypothetical protein
MLLTPSFGHQNGRQQAMSRPEKIRLAAAAAVPQK